MEWQLLTQKMNTRLPALFGVLFLTVFCQANALADIYEWEYIDVSNPALGKRASITLVPDGAGYIAAPRLKAREKNFTKAYLAHADLSYSELAGTKLVGADMSESTLLRLFLESANLTDADLSGSNLTDAQIAFATLTRTNLSGANLNNASLGSSVLTGAVLTDATIRGANLGAVIDLTAEQFYSTGSYKSGNLSGVTFHNNRLTGWDLSDLNLTDTTYFGTTLNGNDLSNSNFTSSNFYNARLIGSNLSGANLTDCDFNLANLKDANLSGAILARAHFGSTTLTGADFQGADVRWAWFTRTTIGFTETQLYSTASYQAGDLTGIRFSASNIAGWNFASQDLSEAYLGATVLTDVDFSNATIRGASFYLTTDFGFTAPQLYSTHSYQTSSLQGIVLGSNDLVGWNFVGQNLSNANFNDSKLAGADFSNAIVRGADFGNTTDTGFTLGVLSSTASYKAGDLRNCILSDNDLTGWNFVGQNLADAQFEDANLDFVDFSGADLRGASSRISRGAKTLLNPPSSANVTNTIRADGRLVSLHVIEGEVMRLRDYNGQTPVPIRIQNSMSLEDTGRLEVVFEDDIWGATISFDAGIDVSLDGTLELRLDEHVDMASLVGTRFQLFDWSGVVPTGMFANIEVQPGTVWDLSQLHSTGHVTLTSVVPEPCAFLIALLACSVPTYVMRR